MPANTSPGDTDRSPCLSIQGGHVSIERTAEMLAELFGAPVFTGFVASCVQRLSAVLTGFEADLKPALIAAPRLHHDETPVPLGGTTAYVYTARAEELVWYGALAAAAMPWWTASASWRVSPECCRRRLARVTTKYSGPARAVASWPRATVLCA